MSKGYQDYFLSFSKSSAHTTGRFDFYASKQNTLLADDIFKLSFDEKVALLYKILNNKIHGIAFSPYLDGQKPGVEISPKQIAQRLSIIKPFTHWIRTFSCVEGSQQTPKIAHKQGLKTLVGIEIGPDKEKNEAEIKSAIEIARAGDVEILSVGNEVLLRGDISAGELIAYIKRIKQALPEQTVGYVDAYFLFENHPLVAEACDVLLVNCYPFWEGTQAEYALAHTTDMYKRAINVAKGKEVIISETGWPSKGTAFGAAMPSIDNALSYFISIYQWAKRDKVKIFYFSAFDESWKIGDEGDVGAYWGLWDALGNIKYIK